MLKILLYLARLLSHLVPMFGANKNVFYTIVSTKLTTDFRRSMNSGLNTKKGKNTFGRQLLTYLLVSIIFANMIYNIDQAEVSFMMMFFILMVLTCMTLLTEFTTVLFNEQDNAIFLPRPIAGKTLLVARLGHILLYLFAIAISFSIIPTVVTIIKYNVITGLLFLFSGLLTAWLSLLITIFFYALMSKFISGEKFKDVLTYVQVGIAIGFMLVYQLVLGTDNSTTMLTEGIFDNWWMYLLVPVWFAKVTVITLTPVGLWNWISLGLILISCVWGAKKIINLMASEFDIILSSVSSSSAKEEKSQKQQGRQWSVYRLFCVSDYEIAGWKLSSTSIKRDRQFKQSVYPMLGYGFVFILLAFIKNYDGDFNQTLINLAKPGNIILFLMPILFLSMPFTFLRYTNNSEAAWVYHLASEDKQYHILSGAIKSAVLRFFLPPVVILTLLVSFIWGASMVFPYILGCSFVLFAALLTEFLDRELPLSLSYDQMSKGKTTIRMFVLMLINGLAFALVYFIRNLHYGFSLGLIAIVFFCIWVTIRAIREK